MAKLRKRPRSRSSAVLLPVALLAAAILSSCIDLSATLEIRANGSGILRLDYAYADFVENLDSAGRADPYLPLPADRAGLEALVAGIAGLRLETWERAELAPGSGGVDRFAVRYSLSFDSTATLTALAAALGRGSVSGTDDPGRGFTLVLAEGAPAVDGGFLAFVAAAFPDAACSFTMRLPSRATSDRGALDAAGTTLTYSVPIAEILSAREPLRWTVRW